MSRDERCHGCDKKLENGSNELFLIYILGLKHAFCQCICEFEHFENINEKLFEILRTVNWGQRRSDFEVNFEVIGNLET